MNGVGESRCADSRNRFNANNKTNR